MNWKTILSTIRDDPKKFWEEGGWNFLNTEASSDEEASESEEEDAYNPSDQSDEEVRLHSFIREEEAHMLHKTIIALL